MTMTNKKNPTTNPEETLKKLFSGSKPAAKNVEVAPEMSPVAHIKVFGVGGGGSNAVNRMIKAHLQGVEFVAINTDAQALLQSPLEQKILIGRSARGRGAGGDPTKGEAAALESENALRRITEDTQLAIITAGMGGGSGTGAAGRSSIHATGTAARTEVRSRVPSKSAATFTRSQRGVSPGPGSSNGWSASSSRVTDSAPCSNSHASSDSTSALHAVK